MSIRNDPDWAAYLARRARERRDLTRRYSFEELERMGRDSMEGYPGHGWGYLRAAAHHPDAPTIYRTTGGLRVRGLQIRNSMEYGSGGFCGECWMQTGSTTWTGWYNGPRGLCTACYHRLEEAGGHGPPPFPGLTDPEFMASQLDLADARAIADHLNRDWDPKWGDAWTAEHFLTWWAEEWWERRAAELRELVDEAEAEEDAPEPPEVDDHPFNAEDFADLPMAPSRRWV